jgi:neutral/alkaline ceramidase-like enzyme
MKKSLLLILFFWGSGAFAYAQGPGGILEGNMTQANITPPVGCRLAGHFYEIFSTGVHDSLWAKVMVLQQGKEKFAFVFCDLIGLTADVSANARLQASAKTGIPVKNIMITAAHSHTGPLFYGFQHTYFHKRALAAGKGHDSHERIDYSRFLIRQIVAAIVKANGAVHPVQLIAGIGEQNGLSFNRRYYMKHGPVLFNPGPLNPDIAGPAGPIDPAVGILLLRDGRSQKYEGGLTVFAMHADCIGGTEMSADYPYFLEQTLKGKLGKRFISAFSLGPSGDVNDVDVKKDQPIYSAANTERIGQTLGKTVINTLSGLPVISRPALAMLSTKILLPLQVPTKEQVDSARVLINSLYEVKKTGRYLANAGGESGDFLKRVEMSKYLALADRKKAVQVEVQVFRIDDETALVGLPGELFVELGLAIKKRSPFKNTIVMTVCNDKTSYIPTQKAFREGSYEVTNAIVKSGDGEMLVATALRLLDAIKN